MKRVYYIANYYDGAYFVLTDNVEEYFKCMASYVYNLKNSSKENTYSFGSVLMTEKDYLSHSQKASELEKKRIDEVRLQKEREQVLEADRSAQSDEEDGAILEIKNKKERPNLRLV